MTILLFGITRDIIGDSVLTITSDIQNITKVKDLKMYLLEKYPKLSNLSSLVVAVNNSYADDATTIKMEDEIALIPPVSGG